MITETGKELLERWIFPMVQVEDDYSLPFTREELNRIHACPQYDGKIKPFLERFLMTQAQGSWAPGSYYPGGWFQALLASGEDPLAVEIEPEKLGRYFLEEILVTEKGRWYAGEKPIQGKVLTFFLEHLEFQPAISRYRIRYRLEHHYETRYIHHRSPPIRVARIVETHGGIDLILNTGIRERLRPDTLWIDSGEELYCAILETGAPAWLSEPARWELLKNAEERGGIWLLNLAGKIHELTPGTAWPFNDIPPG